MKVENIPDYNFFCSLPKTIWVNIKHFDIQIFFSSTNIEFCTYSAKYKYEYEYQVHALLMYMCVYVCGGGGGGGDVTYSLH